MKIKLNLGCGHRIEEGFLGIDIHPFPETDIVYDLEKGIPFNNNKIDEFIASHFLEHIIDPLFVINEIYRTGKKGARAEIRVPLDFPDPAHKVIFQKDWETKYFHIQKFKILLSRIDHIRTKSWKGEAIEYDQSTIIIEVLK